MYNTRDTHTAANTAPLLVINVFGAVAVIIIIIITERHSNIIVNRSNSRLQLACMTVSGNQDMIYT